MKRWVAITVLMAYSALYSLSLQAQCPMCKTSLESSRKGEKVVKPKVGNGINQGILYLLATPYILVGAVGIFWWKNYKKSARKR